MADEEVPDKPIQPGTVMPQQDPEYMTLEEDGQEAFDTMWAEGDTVTPDGYTELPR